MNGRRKAAGRQKPEQAGGRGIALVLGSLFMFIGGLIIWQAMGGPELFGRARMPPWVIVAAGLVFVCAGLGVACTAWGAVKASVAVRNLLVLVLAILFNYLVFSVDLSSESGHGMAGLSPGEKVRIAVVAVDLLVVLGWVLYKTTFVDGNAGPLWQKLAEEDPSIRGAVGVMLLLVPLALAAGLHYAGVLDRVNAAFGQRQAGALPADAPVMALDRYGGWWDMGHSPMFGAGWITRLIIRIDGNDARVNLWHFCPPNHCDEGEFKAKVYGRVPFAVSALEITQVKDGVTRTVQLTPDAQNANGLIIKEARIRGRDWNTNQQTSVGLKRVK